VNYRKVAGTLMAAGLVLGMFGSGVGASFTDSVKAVQNISVGTFQCQISHATAGKIAPDGKSVLYTGPTILSSAPGKAPFSFTVTNMGSINQVLTVSTSRTGNLTTHFSDMLVNPGPQPIAPTGNYTYNAGWQWTELDNTDQGTSGEITYTIKCNENGPTAIFDNTAAALPGNLPSYGPEAYSYNEWGGGVTFAGTARKLSTATVTMSSWACQSGGVYEGTCSTTPGATFDVPITFNVYNVATGNTVGSLIATKTQTFTFPYRPSADTTGKCAPEYWTDGTNCFHGKAVNIMFDFPGQTLPAKAIFGITFNSDHSGYSPLLSPGSPTDSLNIASYPGLDVATQASVGTWLPDDTHSYLSPRSAVTLIGSGAVAQMPTGPSDHFVSYMPAVQITASN
jgi:hypothetical protein